ncbi:MAG: branched-chain amino acid ABC transporter permease [Kouleothrix sp.]|nr:branched-chain amino acid ABC transporter permease [Kouleothrix sp.]
MRNVRLGLWAGIAGIATIMIVGGKTVWMVSIITGLIIGLLLGSNDKITTPREGLRAGAIQGVVAGLLLTIGQLLRSLWLDPLAGQNQLDMGIGPAGSALLAGLIGLAITTIVGTLLGGGQRLRGTARTVAVALIVGAYLLFLPQIDRYLGLGWLGDIIPIMIFIILALGLNIVVGYAGLLDLGYAAFFAIGAYTAGMFSSTHLSGQFGSNFQLSFWLVIWIAAAVAALFGLILGAPTLPLRGDYLAIVTLGFGEIVPILFTNLDEVSWIKTSTGDALNLTGGDPGISAIQAPILPIITSLNGTIGLLVGLIGFALVMFAVYYMTTSVLADQRARGQSSTLTLVMSGVIALFLLYAFFYGAELPGGGRLLVPGIPRVGQFLPTERTPWYYLVIVIFGFSVFFINRLRRSRLGRAWMAMREDELAASSMGIDLVRTKLLAFALGAMFSGFGGAFYGAYLGSITPSSFQFDKSVLILCMVILGGLGNIPGVILGGLIIVSADVFFLNRLTDLLKQIASNSNNEALANFKASDYRLMLFGMVLVMMMLVRPEGLIPSARRKAELHADEEVAAQESVDLFDVEQKNAKLSME